MQSQSYRFASVRERLMIKSDELFMGLAILASMGGVMVTIMGVNGQENWALLLGWLPLAIFIVLRLIWSQKDPASRQRDRLAELGFIADEKIYGGFNLVAFDTYRRRLALIPATYSGTPGVYSFDDVKQVTYEYREGRLGRNEQVVTFHLNDPRAPTVKLQAGETAYARISSILGRPQAA
jgi:hypothetical protein